jgi:hypothetical protein
VAVSGKSISSDEFLQAHNDLIPEIGAMGEWHYHDADFYTLHYFFQ